MINILFDTFCIFLWSYFLAWGMLGLGLPQELCIVYEIVEVTPSDGIWVITIITEFKDYLVRVEENAKATVE